jgi:K+-sensing histidine kinase KdpD
VRGARGCGFIDRADETWQICLAIWFLAVIMVIVFRFGSLAGVLGTILSGMIFAAFLFEPLGRLAVQNNDQKNNLMWMVLLGLAISLFGQPQDKKPAS